MVDSTLVIGITAAAVPTAAAIIGMILQRGDYARLDSRIATVDTRLASGLDSVRGEIAKLNDRQHEDMVMLLKFQSEQDRRVTRLEATKS